MGIAKKAVGTRTGPRAAVIVASEAAWPGKVLTSTSCAALAAAASGEPEAAGICT